LASFDGPSEFLDSLRDATLCFERKTPLIFPVLTVAAMIPLLGAKRALARVLGTPA
jgi:hypothetical protein